MEIHNAAASDFKAHLHSTFRFHHEPAAADMELIEVSDRSAGNHVNFSLIFQGPPDPQLPQRIYPVEHGEMGRFDLFIVPIKREPRGVQYEAVFNCVIDRCNRLK